MPDQELFEVGDMVVWAEPRPCYVAFIQARRAQYGDGPFRVWAVEPSQGPQTGHPQRIAIVQDDKQVGGDGDGKPSWSGVWFCKAR